MHDTTRRVAAWLRQLFAPDSGRRRAASRPTAPAPGHRPEAPPTADKRPPVRRSPYGLDVPLDGSAAALVRPYVLAAEQELVAQYWRCVAVVLAADFGVGLDRRVIGAEGVA